MFSEFVIFIWNEFSKLLVKLKWKWNIQNELKVKSRILRRIAPISIINPFRLLQCSWCMLSHISGDWNRKSNRRLSILLQKQFDWSRIINNLHRKNFLFMSSNYIIRNTYVQIYVKYKSFFNLLYNLMILRLFEIMFLQAIIQVRLFAFVVDLRSSFLVNVF